MVKGSTVWEQLLLYGIHLGLSVSRTWQKISTKLEMSVTIPRVVLLTATPFLARTRYFLIEWDVGYSLLPASPSTAKTKPGCILHEW